MATEQSNHAKHRYHHEGDYFAARIRSSGSRNFMEGDFYPFYPFTVEEAHRTNRFLFREEFCRFMIVSLVLEGRLIYRHGERKYLLEPGMVLLIPPGTSYSFDTFSTGGYRKLVVEFAGPHLESICTTLGLDRFTMQYVGEPAPLLESIDTMRSLFERRDKEEIPELLAAGYKFLLQLSGNLRSRRRNAPLLAQAQQKLESALDQPLEMKEVAAELGMSLTNLNRIFREELHISPQKYRNTCRVEQARELLWHTDLSIKEIAAKLGYCNQFYFSQEFRRYTDQTPTAFRRECRRPS